MERYICIHGHFYQPPRENHGLIHGNGGFCLPYHDWNERITAECYAPNAMSRLLDETGRITEIVNNYSRISFNFGPTLLTWLEKKAKDVYQAILDADRESQSIFSGHGSALAQAYNHMILPLAVSRDKYTQILWGIRDFEHRFERTPEGCGCRRRRWIWKAWRSWQSLGSNSRCLPSTRRCALAGWERTSGMMSAGEGLTPQRLTRFHCHQGKG